jgi:hypothetical protein
MKRGAGSIAALAWLALACACTTVENDPTTNSAVALYQTRVDFMPPSRSERIAQIAHEDRVLADKEASLQAKMDTLHKEREALFESLSAKFPECRSQKHCLSFLTKGDAKQFEDFREARTVLGKVDAEIGEAESTLALWRRRRDLRVRSIYNRYLVKEVLGAAKLDERIDYILVHSAEAFPDRQSISRRLVALSGPNVVPMLVGDLDFRMMNKPVDEAAVLLTLDVRLKAGGRYLSTLLVNTHQLDPQHYERGFQQAWARKFAQADLLRQETYCGLYSIASPMLVGKLGPAKAKPCQDMREAIQALDANRFREANSPDNWMIPVSFRAL